MRKDDLVRLRHMLDAAKHFLLYLTLFLTACAANRTHFSSIEEIQDTVKPNVSTLPAYDLTGGVWVKGHPLLVNSDFDFAVAFGLPDIGPGIAAGNRKRINEETAKLFEACKSFDFCKNGI